MIQESEQETVGRFGFDTLKLDDRQPTTVRTLKRVKCYSTRGHLSTVISALPELGCQTGSQFYLRPDMGNVSSITPAEAGTRFRLSICEYHAQGIYSTMISAPRQNSGGGGDLAR